MKLWETGKEGADEVRRAVESFTVGDDYKSDLNLVLWDCYGSAAHARGLAKIGILNESELQKLLTGLKQVFALSVQGEFVISPSQEDCHTAIEEFLVENVGEVGKKIHAGRSRNDQVLTALKLYSKASAFQVLGLAVELAEALATFARKHPVPMPGYTHMQKAMPSSVTLWASAYADMILDSSAHLFGVTELLDCSPLGSAAGYGVALPLDREFTAKLLGFERVQENVVATQSSRGKNEAALTSALSLLMLDLGKLSADLLFFSQAELGYFSLPAKFCTGSSIMPQKKNPDVLELMRAKAKIVSSLHMQILMIASDLPSGYNRDLQLTKDPLFQSFAITKNALTITRALIAELAVNEDRCRAAMTPELFAADAANELVAQGMPFRDAYRKIKEELAEGARLSTSGNTQINTALSPLAKKTADIKERVSASHSKFSQTLNRCLA